ncbi:bifunctional purine biosynthesis protein PurH-like [Schistocerca gregaria]|uniref:bifunctional purine biosynthesis protein PurH-like n=1 Tax=Schistocerca gregaria TaxID=7010 RepID=UPI00211E6267|nr:bifunctional purine biosynthesis protein PurH-like [Schistocerca gregaria]
MVKRTALVSVSNKEEVVTVCKKLDQAGWNILSTGGTYKLLLDAQVSVTKISDVTCFPEILDGRVKTLHPKIHGGILARDTTAHKEELTKHSIGLIDLVICNLYPFAETVKSGNVKWEKAIEEIDIGGVTLLRAAAKNFERVSVWCDVNDYERVEDLIQDKVTLKDRFEWAQKVFKHTSNYDTEIFKYLSGITVDQRDDSGSLKGGEIGSFNESKDTKTENELLLDSNNAVDKAFEFTENISISLTKPFRLRYGENPHQSACYYRYENSDFWNHRVLSGKELSYNNILDMNAALDVVSEFSIPAVSVIKHLTPCGIAASEDITEALDLALKSDPISSFGSIIAVNRPVSLSFVNMLNNLFLEALVLPSIEQDALEYLKQKKKNCRIIEYEPIQSPKFSNLCMRSVLGGFLVQTLDRSCNTSKDWTIVTKAKPDPELLTDMEFSWKCVKHVKSNAIVLTQKNATVGIGCGQPNRLNSVQLAIQQAGAKVTGSICSSDAFFPFSDCVELLAKNGIRAIIQPGGSIRDQQSIDCADQYGIVMAFTGERHFKH